MMTFIIITLLCIPVAVLLWRVVVTKSRLPRRIGAATAATLTLVGAFSLPPLSLDQSGGYNLGGVRGATALVAAAAGPVYLLVWSRRHRGSGRNKTISVIAAIIGLAPLLATVALAAYTDAHGAH